MFRLMIALVVPASLAVVTAVVSVSAQTPSEPEATLALITKLGGKAVVDESRPARPIIAVDI